MHQKANGESAEQAAHRQTNYLILRTLEAKVEPDVFKDILDKVQSSMDLPTHTAWDGSEVRGTFDELKVSQGQLDDNFLTGLVINFTDPKIVESKTLAQTNNLTHFLKHQASSENDGQQNLFAQLHHKIGHFAVKPRKLMSLQEISKLERVKTVFCHADFQTDEVSSIFNVQFDQTGTFIISGADDGIIKVWDRDTLTLQASLHGHFDYITDMDVSKCNQFIATAGKDAQIIIWELQTGKLIQKIQHHQQQINRIQFFYPKKDNKEYKQDQFLLSCSDDGTVRLYDFSPLSQKGYAKDVRSQEIDQFRIRRSSRQKLPGDSVVSQELFTVELTPNDFRHGNRNKKLDTLALNHNGLVVAGSNTGEMFVWRVNYENIVKRLPKQDCHRFLGQFKIHKNSGIQFCEFSPLKGIPCIGDTLMTGSTDGIVKIWRMNMQNWRKDQKDFTMVDFERLVLEIDENKGCLLTQKEVTQGHTGDSSLVYTQDLVLPQGHNKSNFKTKYLKSQCDAVRWSVNGRFAISSITSQIEKTKEEECHIKIWDTVEQVYYDDLAHHSGQTLKKNTWVLAPHPQYEEILLTGSDGGMLILWNIHQKQILKQFFQNGVYSIDAFVMDNPLDGKWSPDGKAFIVGNQFGTISLYSLETNKVHQYEATRVQQFFQFDIARQQDNPFQKITDRPQICGYNMVPYEVQPSKPLIRFPPENLSSKQFERRLLLGKELGKMEEKYYEDQIINSLNGQLPNQNQGRIESLPESVIPPDAILDVEIEVLSILNDLSPQRPTRARAQQAPRSSARAPQATRSRLQPSRVQPQVQQRAEPIVLSGLYDEDDLDLVRSQIQSDLDEEIEFSNADQTIKEDSSDESDESSGDDLIQQSRNRNGRNTDRNINLRRTNRRGVQERQTRRGKDSLNGEEQINTINFRTRRTVLLEQSSVESFQSSDEEQFKKKPANQGRSERNARFQQTSRRLVRNNRNNQRVAQQSDESSSNERQKPKKSGKTTRNKLDESFQFQSPKINRKLGNSSYLSDHAIDANVKPDSFTSHMLIQAQKFMKGKCETLYELVENAEADLICYLCDRKDPPLVGPFQKKDCSQAHYFHKECIETNTYSYYKVQEKKWVNIESMLKHLKEDAQYQCFRCLKVGASVSCITCGRNFHGFQCAMLYMINVGTTQGIGYNCEGDISKISIQKNCEGVNPYQWQCLFCRNTENYESYENSGVKNQKTYLQSLKKIDKSHLHRATQHLQDQQSLSKISTYIPQVDDIVYYFFQGHENYIYQHSCHFFAGQTQFYPIHETMPWLQQGNHIKDKQMVLCRVFLVQTLYPSLRSIELISQFGRQSTDVVQTPQMIQRIQLKIMNQDKDINSGKIFTVEIFPNELPDYLVLEHVYRHQLEQFQKLKSKNVKIKTKKGTEDVKIVQTNSALEPSFAPNSQWLNIVCTKQVAPLMNPQHRSGRNATAISPENLIRINFWDIVFDQPVPDFNAFSNIEHLKLVQALQMFMNKKKDYLVYFKERVKEDIAKDYRVIIPNEMWFDLLFSRLQNCYYRSQASLMADLHQISINAQLYNGQQHEIAVDAEQVVQKVKMDMLKFISQVGDIQIRERVQEAGKLTATSRLLKTEAELQNQYDQLRPARQALLPRMNTILQSSNNTIEESKEPQFEQPADENKMGKRKRSQHDLQQNQKFQDQVDFELAEVVKVASSQEEMNNGGNSGRQLRNKRQRIV